MRPSAAENKSCLGKPSLLSPVAMEIVSASGVEDALGPWRFDLQAKGHVRRPSSETSSTQRPLVLLFVSMSPFRSASGDIQISHVLRSEVLSVPKSSGGRPRARYDPTQDTAQLRIRTLNPKR